MIAETVTSRMPRGSYSGGAGHDREPALARVYALGADGDAAVVRENREAEVAERAPSVELVHPLAREGSAPAGAAGGAAGRQCADAAADED